MNNNPIAVFDSGLGGLSVWTELRKGLPAESIIYFGDGLNCPYGGRDDSQILEFVDRAVKIMLEHKVKLIVLACNSATAVAIEYLRATYPIPFVGLEPAVKPAALASTSGVIGILATKTSLEGKLFRDTSAKYASQVEIISAVGEGFVQIVEGSKEGTLEAYETVRRVVEPIVEKGADHLVLGCTHYPFLKRAIDKAIGEKKVKVINPSRAIERRVESLLEEADIAAEASHIPEYKFLSFGGEAYVDKLENKSKEALKLFSEQ